MAVLLRFILQRYCSTRLDAKSQANSQFYSSAQDVANSVQSYYDAKAGNYTAVLWTDAVSSVISVEVI